MEGERHAEETCLLFLAGQVEVASLLCWCGCSGPSLRPWERAGVCQGGKRRRRMDGSLNLASLDRSSLNFLITMLLV